MRGDAEAYKWLNLAAAQENRWAKSVRDLLEPRLTAEQRAEAQRRSREWLESKKAGDE